jgi:hypothetical protein
MGYTGETFEDKVFIDEGRFTFDITTTEKRRKNGSIEVRRYASKTATWHNIVDFRDYVTNPQVYKFMEEVVEPASRIYVNYHENLYEGISKYKREHTAPTLKRDKQVHIGGGLHIKHSDKITKAVLRTVQNSLFQGWSFLTLIALERLRRKIYANNLQDKVKIQSSVYDSIYLMVKSEPEIIKWVVETAKPLMVQDFIIDQVIKLKSDFEISYDTWSDFKKL